MPAALDALIVSGHTQGGLGLSYLLQARNHLYQTATSIAAMDWPNAKVWLDAAADDFGTGFSYCWQDNEFTHGLRDYWDQALHWISDNWPAVGGATMDDILNAMLGATFDQLTAFMGITQAYNVAVWDAPFNEEYYAALARGFRQWGT